ncbi:N-formylglutamate amidohydrolase [Pandoraea thiooxydans]|nr:N-formylglutamate amidohydrolase [Pandoraea thiooxydans]AKJ69266.3 N-formylglutamate amidohydrolase [Pandoraea thiooxydans]APR96875.1 N-formylglutamate amidohydrolase [Pandoraea thiooxydans]
MLPRHVVDGRYFVEAPLEACVPVVCDSPHSGIVFPADFATSAPLEAIYTSWDAHVDELWAEAPRFGAVLLGALFPRAYIDPNRAIHDIDPDLLAQLWPHDAQPGECSQRGVGLIRRYAAPGVPMYDRRLNVAEVERRLHDYYQPYRQALSDALEQAWQRNGMVWHLNCHSMRSRGGNLNRDSGQARPDVAISDNHGSTADPAFTEWVVSRFEAMGYRVGADALHQGGDLIRSYGDPPRQRHSVQIAINRALYMDETTCEKHEGFDVVRENIGQFLRELCDFVGQRLSADERPSQ